MSEDQPTTTVADYIKALDAQTPEAKTSHITHIMQISPSAPLKTGKGNRVQVLVRCYTCKKEIWFSFNKWSLRKLVRLHKYRPFELVNADRFGIRTEPVSEDLNLEEFVGKP